MNGVEGPDTLNPNRKQLQDKRSNLRMCWMNGDVAINCMSMMGMCRFETATGKERRSMLKERWRKSITCFIRSRLVAHNSQYFIRIKLSPERVRPCLRIDRGGRIDPFHRLPLSHVQPSSSSLIAFPGCDIS